MSLLDLLIVLVVLIVCILAHLALTPYVLAVGVACLCIERVLKGERL